MNLSMLMFYFYGNWVNVAATVIAPQGSPPAEKEGGKERSRSKDTGERKRQRKKKKISHPQPPPLAFSRNSYSRKKVGRNFFFVFMEGRPPEKEEREKKIRPGGWSAAAKKKKIGKKKRSVSTSSPSFCFVPFFFLTLPTVSHIFGKAEGRAKKGRKT